MEIYLLIAGIPGAGKSTLGDRVESSDIGFTHIPLDKDIKPVPSGGSFLDWVRGPSCVDWPLLDEHIEILRSGEICYTPSPDWNDGGARVSVGGALTNGAGRKMKPSPSGYVIPGTHSFSFVTGHRKAVRVYVDTPDEVIASRLEGCTVAKAGAPGVIAKHLGDNPTPLRGLRSEADIIVSGMDDHAQQLVSVAAALAKCQVDA